MKIVKGLLKGRQIHIPRFIRVASSRVRKSLFDLLAEEIENKVMLDLFAGSGSLGIEALSRGAEQAYFVDIKASCVDAIKKNLSLLGLNYKSKVILKDANKAIKDFKKRGCRFDFIFLDPPYYKGFLRKTLQTLDEYAILNPLGFIVCLGYYKDCIIKKSNTFSLFLTKKYGQTLLLIYNKNEESDMPRDI